MTIYFTDGSASPNPGPGGFAVIKNGKPYLLGGEPSGSGIARTNTTNIRMEGFAILAALADSLGEQDKFPSSAQPADFRDKNFSSRIQNQISTSSSNLDSNQENFFGKPEAALDEGNLSCEIHTDSQFWINVLTKWAPGWAANNWRKKTKGEIQNLDIVRPLFELFQKSDAKLVFVRGHVGTELNELADEWANRARELKLTDVRFVKDLS